MLTNADITLYNRKYDEKTRLDTWKRTVFHNVHFYVDNKVSVGDNGLISAEVYKIRIPVSAECNKSYVDEDKWCVSDIVDSMWTLQNDDYVVLGECTDEIDKPSGLNNKRHCKITSWSDNRTGGLPHWRIGGV